MTTKEAQEQNLAEVASYLHDAPGIVTLSRRQRVQLVVTDALALQKLARSLHRLYEAKYNYQLTDRQETRRSRLQDKAERIAGPYGLEVYHQGDPRGWPIYLVAHDLVVGSKYGIGSVYHQGMGGCPH